MKEGEEKGRVRGGRKRDGEKGRVGIGREKKRQGVGICVAVKRKSRKEGGRG